MRLTLRRRIIITLVGVVGATVCLWYPVVAALCGFDSPRFILERHLRLGLDLAGGVQFSLRVNVDEALDREAASALERGEAVPDAERLRRETIAQARRTIERRVDALGVAEPLISLQGPRGDRFLVQLPGLDDPARVRGILQSTAMLEWKLVEKGPAPSRDALLPADGPVPPDAEVVTGETTTGEPSYFLVRRAPEMTGRDLRSVRATRDAFNRPAVGFTLTPDGARRFGDATGANVGRQLAIVLDGKVESAPWIEGRIAGGEGVIEGTFSTQEAADLSLVLRTGALPVSMTYLGGSYVGPSLGADSVRAGLLASGTGLAFVGVFLLAYYKGAGLNAVVCLAANLLVLLGVMASFSAVLTLPGMAGLALTVGMGVDSSVLIFERIKEERSTGRSARQAIAVGFDRVWRTIFDTHASSLIAAAFLFRFGTGPVRGFATTLSVGLLANMFTSVFVSRTIFQMMASRGGRLSI
jgi:preprotein translocase subunit SecD